MNWRRVVVLGVGAAALAGVAVPVVSQVPELAMLGTLTPGSWELRSRSDDSRRTICLRTGRELIQLRHTQTGCSTYVVQDGPTEVVVQYSCRGDGYGRTSIRKEGPTLVQVHSQGSQNGAPFVIQGEARRLGNC